MIFRNKNPEPGTKAAVIQRFDTLYERARKESSAAILGKLGLGLQREVRTEEGSQYRVIETTGSDGHRESWEIRPTSPRGDFMRVTRLEDGTLQETPATIAEIEAQIAQIEEHLI